MSNNTNAPVIDVALLRKTLEHIENHPEEWNQGFWVYRMNCGTAYCFAGHAAEIMGCDWAKHNDEYVLADEADREWCEGQRYADIVTAADGRDYIHCSYRAERLLGLTVDQRTKLFAPQNSLETLQHLVETYEREALS
jgi:hypothetical protein